MKKTSLLIVAALSSLFSSSYGQGNGGKMLYSQLGQVVNKFTGYYSWNDPTPPPLGTGSSIVADDFVVPAGGWNVYGAAYVTNHAPGFFTSYDIKIYANAAGNKPALNPLYSVNIVAANVDELELMTSVTQCNFKFPTLVNFPAGTYWLSITGVGPLTSGLWITNNAPNPPTGNPAKLRVSASIWNTQSNASNNNGMYQNLAFALYAAPETNDLSARQITAPMTGTLTANQQVKVAIQNTGTATQNSFQVRYDVRISGQPTIIQSVTSPVVNQSIAANGIYNYTFTTGANLSALNSYSITATVILAGDTNPANDAITKTVINLGTTCSMGVDNSITTCNAVFMDDGGYDGAYTAASMDTIVFIPGIAGNRIMLNFTYINVWDNDFESWTFYDGSNTNAPILFKKERLAPWWTGPIKARNSTGAITLVTKKNSQFNPQGYDGWVANVTCFTPPPIDFTALNLTVGSPSTYNVTGQPVNISFTVTNAGTTTTSRTVTFLQNGVSVGTMNTATLAPGAQQTLTFTWTPTVVSKNVNFKAVIQTDGNSPSTDTDNSLEKTVDVNRSGILLESFEGATLPLNWAAQAATYNTGVTNTYATHGSKIIQIKHAGDTLRTPLCSPVAGDSLSFWTYLADDTMSLKVIAKNASTGVWSTVGTANKLPGFTMNKYTFSLSGFTNGSYYFAFVTQNGGSTYSYIYLDDVRGATLATTALTLNLKALIQGRYTGGTMAIDPVTVELRSITNPNLTVASSTANLNATGNGTFNFTGATNGASYYIVVKHRNSIQTWSNQVIFTNNMLYDFTSAATQAYASNLIQIAGKWCIYTGDVNQDGIIDSSDLSAVDNDAFNFVQGYELTDLNGDLIVDSTDLGVVDNNAFNFVSVARP